MNPKITANGNAGDGKIKSSGVALDKGNYYTIQPTAELLLS